MEFNEFCNIVKEFFGKKLSFYCLDVNTQTINCILYESFEVDLSIGDRYGVFGASISLGSEKYSLTNVLGKDISLDSDVQSIKDNLEIIDYYCRLRLPDKFLTAFDSL